MELAITIPNLDSLSKKQERETMTSSSKSQHNHIRSISLPGKSHPTILRIEEELNKLKPWEACSSSSLKTETICNGLSGLENLHHCLDDLLNLPLTQQAIFQHGHEKWADGLLDRSVRLLDICNITRDVMSQTKEHVRDLGSSLRRRKGELSVESSIAKYIAIRKKMKTESKRIISELKQMDTEFCSSPLLDIDHHSQVIRVLKEVILMNVSVHQSIIWFLSVPVSKPKPSRWSLVSKLIYNQKIASDDQQENTNEFKSIDSAIYNLCKHDSGDFKNFQIIQNKLEALEVAIAGIESGLECVFTGLIRTRASLLNIFSH